MDSILRPNAVSTTSYLHDTIDFPQSLRKYYLSQIFIYWVGLITQPCIVDKAVSWVCVCLACSSMHWGYYYSFFWRCLQVLRREVADEIAFSVNFFCRRMASLFTCRCAWQMFGSCTLLLLPLHILLGEPKSRKHAISRGGGGSWQLRILQVDEKCGSYIFCNTLYIQLHPVCSEALKAV